MRKLIITLVLSTVSIVPLLGRAQQLADNAPSSYTVVRGDSLWSISGKFLKDPWRWPDIWNMNRDQIKNPHLIYPGDVIRLDFGADGRPRLSIDGQASVGGTVKLSPRIRTDSLSQSIPSIPGAAIGPFLTMPLVVDSKGLEDSPKIVAMEDGRVIVGTGNIAYVDRIDPALGAKWQIYRRGKPLTDPDTQEIIGYEASYVADVRVTRFGEPSTIEVVRSKEEITRGDRLSPNREAVVPSYSPRAPEAKINGKIISVSGGVAETAQYAIVALNRGKQDGLEVGHVLVTYRAGEVVSTKDDAGTQFGRGVKPVYAVPPLVIPGITKSSDLPEVKLPDERNGLVFVFRVFDRISYALVMQTRRPIHIGDTVLTP